MLGAQDLVHLLKPKKSNLKAKEETMVVSEYDQFLHWLLGVFC